MSKEYIERKAICEKCNNKESCFPYPEMRAKCPVYNASIADVAPVIHAKWRKVSDYWTCSNCSTVTRSKDDEYCRHCGALMEGGNK